MQSFVAWMVAGGLAYYLYVVPDKQRAEEQQVCGWWMLGLMSASVCMLGLPAFLLFLQH